MTRIRQILLQGSLSLLLALSFVLSLGAANAFAAETQAKCPAPAMSLPVPFFMTADGYINTTFTDWYINITAGMGSTYYYTVDGSEPSSAEGTSSKKVTTTTIQVSKSWLTSNGITGDAAEIKMIATKSGMTDSDVVTFSFKLLPEGDVPFTDRNLKLAVCRTLGIAEDVNAHIIQQQMESLTELVAEDKGIADLYGLQYATNLEVLRLSGNDLITAMQNNVSGAFDFSTLTKLKSVDLSNCNIGAYGTNYTDKTRDKLANILKNCPDIEAVDFSGNNLTGTVTLNIKDKEKLKTLDFSGNYLSGITFQDDSGAVTFDGAALFPALEKLDFSNNCYEHKETNASYADFLTFSGDVLDYSDQKSAATVLAVQVKGPNDAGLTSSSSQYVINRQTKNVNIGTVKADSVTIAILGADTTGKTVAAIQGKTHAVLTATDTDFTTNNSAMVISDLPIGTSVIPVSVLQENGATDQFNIVVTREKLSSSTAEDSAGITDPIIYTAVTSAIAIEGNYITKDDMARLTGTLTINGKAKNLNGLEYAVNLSGLVINDGDYTAIPDISGLTKLTTLTIQSSHVTALPDLTAMVNLTSLTLYGSEVTSLPDLSENTKITMLSLAFDQLDKLPELSALTGLKTLHLGDEKGGFMNSSLTAAAVAAALSQAKEVKTMTVNYAPKVTTLDPGGTVPAANITSLTITASPNFEKVGAILPKLTALRINGNDETSAFTFAGLENCAASKLNINLYNIKDMTMKGFAENNTAVKSVTFRYCDDIVIAPEIASSSADTISVYYGNGNISFPSELKDSALKTIYLSNTPIGEIPDSIYDITSLTALTIRFCGELPVLSEKIGQLTNLTTLNLTQTAFTELPEGIFALTNLTALTIYNSDISDFSGDWSVFKNLKTLTLENANMTEIPASIADCPSLTSLSLLYNFITDVPDGFMEKLSSSVALSLTGYFKRDYIDNTSAQTKIASLSDAGLKEKLGAFKGRWYNLILNDTMAELVRVETADQTYYQSQDNPVTTFSAYLPAGTTTFTFTPYAVLPDTVITYNDTTVAQGEQITVEGLKEGMNTFTFTVSNGAAVERVYTFSIYVGGRIEVGNMQEGTEYSIGMQYYMAASDTLSMTNNYFLHREKVVYENGQYAVQLTTTHSDYVGYLNYRNANGEMVRAAEVKKDTANNTCTYLVYVDDLAKPLTISPMVYPMGYAPTCRVIFDTASIMPYNADEVETPGLELTDEATGIQIHAGDGVLAADARLVVETITSGAEYENAAKALQDTGKEFKLYTVYFVNVAGEKIEPNGIVTVHFPLTEADAAASALLYRIDADAGKTLMQGTPKEGYYTTELTDFSRPYAFMENTGIPIAFNDIDGHWGKDAIGFATSRGLFNGTTPTTFTPNGSMTRGMFVTVLGRMAKVDTGAYSGASFPDVNATAYYAPYIQWAADNGIVNGISRTSFAPEEAVTREQAATILARYLAVTSDSAVAESGEVVEELAPLSEEAVETVPAEEDTVETQTPDEDTSETQTNATEAIETETSSAEEAAVEEAGKEQTVEEPAAVMEEAAVAAEISVADDTAVLAAITFADAGKISAWAKDSVEMVQEKGIFKGDEQNRFNPQASITRAEAATVFARLLGFEG